MNLLERGFTDVVEWAVSAPYYELAVVALLCLFAIFTIEFKLFKRKVKKRLEDIDGKTI